MTKSKNTGLYLSILSVGVVLITQTTAPQNVAKSSPVVSKNQIAEIALAIQDEVYDYSQQKFFYDADVTTESLERKPTKIPLYIKPNLSTDGAGEVIYKDFPYGEVIRQFHIRPDGLVVFYSDPQLGFPQTQPSHLTQFLDVDELRRDKEQWLHGEVEIENTPSRERVIEAAKRQLIRVNFSDFLWSKSHPKSQ
jgi:hypothetical protein